MKVRLTKKLAAVLNDIDLSAWNVGDIIEFPERSARLLIAEGWAEPVESQTGQSLPTPSRDLESEQTRCPNCNRAGHVRLERVLKGEEASTHFSCGLCQHQWSGSEATLPSQFTDPTTNPKGPRN